MLRTKMGACGGVLLAIAFGWCLAGTTVQAEPILVIHETFERTDWSKPFGTAPNATNLPGGTWTMVAGYSSSGDQGKVVYAGWASTPSKSLIMGTGGTGNSGNTNIGLAAPLTGYSPTTISADAKTLWTNNTNYGSFALGFYGATLPEANTDGVGYLSGFTGIAASRNGTLTLYENGVTAGTSVATGVTMSWAVRSLSYDINPVTGAISNVTWGGETVDGLHSTAFTPEATVHAAVLAFNSGGGYSQTVVDNFQVMGTTAIPEPTMLGGLIVGMFALRRRRV